jgi:hypothetical protein
MLTDERTEDDSYNADEVCYFTINELEVWKVEILPH